MFDIFPTSGILTQELDPDLTSRLPPHHNYSAYLGTVRFCLALIVIIYWAGLGLYYPYSKRGLNCGYFAFQLSVASSYVDWAMSGGARVVPIIIGRDKEYYRKVGIVQVLLLIRIEKKAFQNSLDK